MDGTKVSAGTITRTIAAAIAGAVYLLQMFGVRLPVIDASEAAMAIVAVASLAVMAWGFWKNNSYTIHAIVGDETKDDVKKQLEEIKAGNYTYEDASEEAPDENTINADDMGFEGAEGVPAGEVTNED